jgi:hypothetical protein
VNFFLGRGQTSDGVCDKLFIWHSEFDEEAAGIFIKFFREKSALRSLRFVKISNAKHISLMLQALQENKTITTLEVENI